jgi:nucleotide-binding universal stress UspA family protein
MELVIAVNVWQSSNDDFYYRKSNPMKNLLVLTDFSAEANHAAAYAYSLAIELKADLTLCNAIKVPAETPLASFVSWPMEQSGDLIKESNHELEKLRNSLEKSGKKLVERPKVNVINQTGSLKDVAENILFDQFIDLTIMGAHGAGGISEFILGSQSRYMIDHFNAPIMLVPLSAKIKPIKRIVFATDFHFTQSNKEFIMKLVPLAKSFGAEIFISHIHSTGKESDGFDEMVKAFMFEICSEFKTPRISYRSIESFSTKNGLEVLMSDGQMDMLVMVHREKCFLSDLLIGSLTKRMASSIAFPLLVFKKDEGSPVVKKIDHLEINLPFAPANI